MWLIRSIFRNTGKTGILGLRSLYKMQALLYAVQQKLETKQSLSIFLFMVKPHSDSPFPKLAKTKGNCPKTGCLLLPAVCFPPEITRRQMHSKGKQWAFCHPLLPHPQCSALAQLCVRDRSAQS